MITLTLYFTLWFIFELKSEVWLNHMARKTFTKIKPA